MITDSIPWKQDLFSIALRLERRKSQKRWTERTSFLVERDVMVGAYIMRKLIQTPAKVSDEAKSHQIRANRHELRGKTPDFWDDHNFWDNYDMHNSTPVLLSLPKFANQVIHSLVWSISVADTGDFDGILVASDTQSKLSLMFIPIDEMVNSFIRIANDDFVHLESRRQVDGSMKVVRASSRY